MATPMLAGRCGHLSHVPAWNKHSPHLFPTAQDLARGKRSEIDHLNGYVLRKGEALNIATPVNRVLHTLVKLLAGRRRLSVQASDVFRRSNRW